MLLKVCRRAGLGEQGIELAHVLVPVPCLQRKKDLVAADVAVAVPVRDPKDPLEFLVRHARPTAGLGRPAFFFFRAAQMDFMRPPEFRS